MMLRLVSGFPLLRTSWAEIESRLPFKIFSTLPFSVNVTTMKIHFESYQSLTGPFSVPKSCQYNFLGYKWIVFLIFSKYGHIISYLSISVSRDESLNPFANGLLSILSLVICKTKGKRSEVLMQFLHFRFHLELTYQVLLFNAYLILLLPCGASGASKAKLF